MNLANVLLGIVIGIILWRWWRKHRVKINRWWQKHEESAPRQWHPKSEKACPCCQNGLHVTLARVNQAVQPRAAKNEKRVSSKVLPSLHLGARKAEDAYALVHDLKHRLTETYVPAFTTDGLRSYFYALTAHFGPWHQAVGDRVAKWQVESTLLYGQLVKRRERQKVVFHDAHFVGHTRGFNGRSSGARVFELYSDGLY